MAHKLAPNEAAQTAGEDDSPAAQLEALSPDIELELCGRRFTVREYRVLEGMEAAAIGAGFIRDLVAASRGGTFSYAHVRPLIGRHMPEIVALVSKSTGLDPEWIRGIRDRDAMETLLMTWFGVNSGFFVHEVVAAMRVERLEAIAQAGSTFSPGSPKADSATSTDSPS